MKRTAMKQTMTLATASLLVAMAIPAVADEQEQTFSEMDADRNGVLDRQEAQSDPNLQVYFGRADTDADGGITLSEYQVFAADLARAREDVPAE